jgi:hypothetical protein
MNNGFQHTEEAIKQRGEVFTPDGLVSDMLGKLPRYSGVNVVLGDYLTWRPNMKFDVIAGNPPYNDTRNETGATTTLWEKFITKSLSLLKDGGYLCYVHPCGWRSPVGKFADTHALLTSRQIKYLEIHDATDGRTTFGAGTRYDWYVLQNQPANGNTVIVGEDGKKYEANLGELPFIPNGMIEELRSLIAKPGEPTCEILFSWSAYDPRKPWMHRTETKEFKYPVIHSIKKGGLNLVYSSTNEKGHFGIPKIVLGWGQSNTYIDRKGTYGLSQHSWSIVDAPENLDKINAALNSKRFIELSSYCCLSSSAMFVDRYNKDVMALFRKDFWKAFV